VKPTLSGALISKSGKYLTSIIDLKAISSEKLLSSEKQKITAILHTIEKSLTWHISFFYHATS
jgi:hypothetical protein